MLEKDKKMKELSDDKLENVGGGSAIQEKDGTWTALYRIDSLDSQGSYLGRLATRGGFKSREEADAWHPTRN